MAAAKATSAALLILLSAIIPAEAADPAAGKAIAQAKCIQCHEADDWEGEGAPLLESLIKDIVAGKVKHKTRLELTPAEAANIAAYWGSSGR